MPLSRIVSQASIACCVVAVFAAGEAVAQGMTPLRVDPTLLGMPPVEKKAPPPPAKKTEPATPVAPAAEAPAETQTERPRAEVKTVDPSAVEAKPLTEEAAGSPSAAERRKAEPKQPARAASPDRIPAQAVAPSTPATPVVAEPVPAPVPVQTGAPAAVVPAPRPREDARAPSRAPAAAAASAPPSVGGKVTTLAPLSVHPGLLGLPAPAVAGAASRSGSAAASAAATGTASAPSTVAGIEKNVEASWRSGQPPMLSFHGEPLELPEGGAGTPALKTAKTLQPIQSSGMPLPMFLTADDLAGVTDHETVATGNVEARKAGSVVNADRMIYRPVEDQLEAVGNVSLYQGEDVISGPRMRLKMADQTGFFDQPNYLLKREAKWALKERERLVKGEKGSTAVDANALAAWNTSAARQSRPEPGSLMNVLGVSAEVADDIPKSEARGTAERMDFEGENRFRLFNNTYTTCKPGDNGWYVKTDELALDYDREVAEGKGGTIYFKDAPIFYTPWLSFSLNNQRKSGFLTPTIGNSSVNGLMISAPYYWNIASNMDATFSPRVYSKRGVQLASEFRYLSHSYGGTVRAEVMPNDRLSDGESRYAYSLQHQQNFGHGFGGLLNISGVSDDDYFADLSSRSVVSSQRQLLRQGVLSYGSPSGWWSASMVGQSYQTLNPDRTPGQQIEHVYSLAPQVNLSARRPDYLGADLAFLGQYTSFRHHDATNRDPSLRKDEGTRFVAYPQVALPFVQPGWYVTPKVGAHVTHYSIDRNVPGTLGDPGSITRSLPIVSVDSGMTFERDTTWFGARATQTLEPRLYYLYVPYRDQSRIPVFDSGVADFNFAQIFSENQFSGYDRVSDAHQLTAAVVTRLIDPTSGAEAMRAMFGQRYYFRRQQVTLPGATALRASAVDKWNRSDFLAAFSGRVLPKTFLDAALQYNPSDARMERSSIGMRYQPDFGKVLNASYRFGSKEIAGGTAFKNFDVAGQWPIWGGLSAVGRYNYSILDHKPVETVGGLEYSEGCWAVRVVGHQVATTTGKSNKSLFVQLELTDFARIGSNPIDLLRRNITGYGLSSQPVADPVFGE